MTAIQIGSEWFVAEDTVVGPFESHSDAWRWIDRREGDHSIPRSETISPWLWDEALSK